MNSLMNFLALCVAICLIGMMICGTGVAMSSFDLSSGETIFGIITSLIISILGLHLFAGYMQKASDSYYGFEAPLAFLLFSIGIPMLVGKSMMLLKHVF